MACGSIVDSEAMGNTVNSLLVTGLLAANLVSGADIYRMDLSAYPHNHALTREEAADLFQSPDILSSPASRSFDAGLIRVENDPFGGSGKVLSIQFRGGTSMLGTSKNPSGAQWKVGFGGKNYTDLYMSVQLGVDGKWISPRGMHLPFLSVEPFVAEVSPNPDTWASFLQLAGNNSYVNSVTAPLDRNIADDSIALYYYTLTKAQRYAWLNTANPTQWSSSRLPHNGQATLARNGYITLEQRLKLNSVPSYDNPTGDGAMQAWADGQLAIDKQSAVWRRDASQKMTYAWFLFWTGGGNEPEWFQPQDQKIYVRSFVLSTKPITH